MNSNWIYSLETPNLGQIQRFFEPCDLEIWRMTLKNNRVPLLSHIKLCASFRHHMWIQTGVTVRKWLGFDLCWVLTFVTLTFDLWPWPFAWTLLWSLVITPENFMMMRWWEHSEKGVTDGQTENTICRAAWSQLTITKDRVWFLWDTTFYLLFRRRHVIVCHILFPIAETTLSLSNYFKALP